MAVCLFFHGPGVTREQYYQVCGEVLPGERPPQGASYHVAGASDDGWCVAEVWESQEALNEFVQKTLTPALEKAGIQGHVRTFQVDRVLKS